MKLSKHNLKVLLRHSAWDELSKACDNGTLEIEGYVREDHLRDTTKMVDDWVKLDPNDPKTFPKQYPVMILLYYGGIDICAYFYEGKFQTGVVDSYAPEKITHWRPIPKRPQEMEETK